MSIFANASNNMSREAKTYTVEEVAKVPVTITLETQSLLMPS